MGNMTLSAISDRSFSGFMPIFTSAFFGAVVLATALLIFSRRDF
jgi:hypothetical protein